MLNVVTKQRITLTGEDLVEAYPRRGLSAYAHGRSLEKYLELHKYTFTVKDTTYTIDVTSAVDAMRLGVHFHQRTVQYYDGVSWTTIELTGKKMKLRSAKYFMTKTVLVPITRKEFLRQERERIDAEYVAPKVLVRNKSFTLSKLKTLEKNGKLKAYKEGRRLMYKKEDILALLQKELAKPAQAHLFTN